MASTLKVFLNDNPPACEDDDLNGFVLENNNLIVGSGQTLDAGDRQQTHKAVATYAAGGDFYLESGAADAYVLSPVGTKVAPPAYFEGMRARFVPGNSSTGSATVNVAGLGVIDVLGDSGAIAAGVPAELLILSDGGGGWEAAVTNGGARSSVVSEVWVEQFGADPGLADNAPAIQAALDFAFDLGLIVRAGAGIFELGTALTLPNAASPRVWRSAQFIGTGANKETAYVTGGFTYGTTLKAAAGYSGPLVLGTSTRHVRLKDMLLVGNKGAGSTGFTFDQFNIDTEFENIKFYGFEACFRIGNITNAAPGNDDTFSLKNCYFGNCTYGIDNQAKEGFLIRGEKCYFDTTCDTAYRAAFNPLYDPPSANFIPDGCMFLVSVAAFELGHNTRGALHAKGCHFEGAGVVLDAESSLGLGGILPAVTIEGSNFNGAYDLVTPMIKYIGQGNLVVQGNNAESLSPLIVVDASNPFGQALFQGNRWFGKPVYRNAAGTGYGHVVEIAERALYDTGTTDGARTPVSSIRIRGRAIDYDDIIDFSGRNTKERGGLMINATPSLNNSALTSIIQKGTTGTLNGGATTGGITTGTKALVVNSATNLYVGCYITIAGVSGIKRVDAISGTAITIDSNADATVAGAAVAYSAPITKNIDAVSGSFTLAAASTKVVGEPDVKATSRIVITATSASAALLMGSAKSLYISLKTAGASFTVATGDGTAAAGTETFDYQLVN